MSDRRKRILRLSNEVLSFGLIALIAAAVFWPGRPPAPGIDYTATATIKDRAHTRK
jgi:hypothetical protein